MAGFLLVHGSWHGAWCWEKLAPVLRSQGHQVVTPDLPSHGNDRTPALRTTMAGYAQCIRDAAGAFATPPVVMGHSMGGFAMTEAAARYPGAFAGLVYLCAFVPQPGERLLDLALGDKDTALPMGMKRGLFVTTFRTERAREVFYGTSPATCCEEAAARLRPEPMMPALARSSQPKGALPPRAYIECLADRAITIGHQRMMYHRAGIAQVSTMDTDHSPFYADPATLATQLTGHATAFAASAQR
jgi:pimeloyl-ACP methyl ester carboxylesterase